MFVRSPLGKTATNSRPPAVYTAESHDDDIIIITKAAV